MKFIVNNLAQQCSRRLADRAQRRLLPTGFRQHIAVLALIALITLVGCATPEAPSHRTAEHIQSAANLANAIQFHTNALPAEAAPAPDQLSLSVALERALQQSPDLQLALSRVRTTQADAHQSLLWPNPVLDIVLRAPEGGGRTVIETGLAAELTQLLQRPRRISAADARLRAASAAAVTTALEILHHTQQTYFNAIVARQESLLLAQRAARLNALLMITEARLEAGEGTQLDVITLKAELTHANLDLREADRRRKTALFQLAHLLGQPRGRTDWQLATPLYTQVALRGEQDAIAHGLRVRPEIQTDRWQLAALEDAQALARLAWLEGAAAGLNTERDSDWSLGPSLTLPLPLFDNGQARRARARAQAIAARQRLTQSTRQVVSEIREAHHAVAELMTTTRQARTQLLPLHAQRVALARQVFEAGQEDVTRLRLAELDHLEAQLKTLRLQHQTARAVLRLDRATGGSTLEIENESN
ncbi:MAG: TolC family protein [Verrucomicrobia subdivision 3 bacterium]|nr:TolC family protein [Limisphaerales bacterium]